VEDLLVNQIKQQRRSGHDRLPKLPTKDGETLISQPVTSYLTNQSELCMSRLLNNQSRWISIYGLQWRPSFVGKFSVSSALLTSVVSVG